MGKDMKRSALVLIAVLVVSGCASPVTPVAADQRYFDAACDRIKMTPQDVLRKKYSFVIDTSETVFSKPVDGVHGRSVEKLYSVDIPSYVNYVSELLLPRGAPKVRIDTLDVEVGDNGVMAEEAPVFFIKVRGRNSAGHAFSLEKGASGPAVSDFQGPDNRTKKMIESANIAFMAAFLRIVVSIEDQLEVGGRGKEPNKTATDNLRGAAPAVSEP